MGNVMDEPRVKGRGPTPRNAYDLILREDGPSGDQRALSGLPIPSSLHRALEGRRPRYSGPRLIEQGENAITSRSDQVPFRMLRQIDGIDMIMTCRSLALITVSISD
jgi:hypothetical protein